MLRRREIGALVKDAVSHSASGHHTCPALSLGDPRAGCDASRSSDTPPHPAVHMPAVTAATQAVLPVPSRMIGVPRQLDGSMGLAQHVSGSRVRQ